MGSLASPSQIVCSFKWMPTFMKIWTTFVLKQSLMIDKNLSRFSQFQFKSEN